MDARVSKLASAPRDAGSSRPPQASAPANQSPSWPPIAPAGTVLATPYLIVQHVRGHGTGHAVLRHRLGHAFHALLDIAPHRLFGAIRRSRLAR